MWLIALVKKEIRSAIKAYRKNLSAHAEYQLESAVGFPIF